MVKKRIASRFFSVIGGKMSNPLPGTVIDTEVTRPEWWVSATLLLSGSHYLLHVYVKSCSHFVPGMISTL